MTACLPILALALTLGSAPAAEVHLLTMGPGDHLYTRGGHAALMVVRDDPSGRKEAVVYNYGDTDWEDPGLVGRFLRGNLLFRLADPLTLEQVIDLYGVQQNRDIYRQKLNLDPAEVARVLARLEHDLQPEHRTYPYHHVDAICSTRVRDILEEATDGALSRALSSHLDPHTVRDYQQMAFEWHLPALVGADLFLGGRHDRRPSTYEVLFQPRRMRALLQRVPLAPSADGLPRPLAEAPSPLTRRAGSPAIEESTGSAVSIQVGMLLFLVASFGWAFRSRVAGVRRRRLWVGFWGLLSGVIGCVIVSFMVLSRVPELSRNELIYSFPPTDLAVGVAALLGALRDRPWPRWIRFYGLLRLGAMAAVAVAHPLGLLSQRPLAWPLMAGIFAVGLWLVGSHPKTPPVP